MLSIDTNKLYHVEIKSGGWDNSYCIVNGSDLEIDGGTVLIKRGKRVFYTYNIYNKCDDWYYTNDKEVTLHRYVRFRKIIELPEDPNIFESEGHMKVNLYTIAVKRIEKEFEDCRKISFFLSRWFNTLDAKYRLAEYQKYLDEAKTEIENANT